MICLNLNDFEFFALVAGQADSRFIYCQAFDLEGVVEEGFGDQSAGGGDGVGVEWYRPGFRAVDVGVGDQSILKKYW